MTVRERGFSLIETMIALVIVMLVLFAAMNFFIVTVKQYKVQTKIVETNVEGVLGLELLRQDLEGLGFGLPWNNLPSYTERTVVPSSVLDLNDGSGIAPRAVVSINNASFTVNHSDYLVVKSALVGMKEAAGKWTTLSNAGTTRSWTPGEENLAGGDYVIVLRLGGADTRRRSLVNPSSPYVQFASVSASGDYLPVEPYISNVIYGIDNQLPIRPFNRADYYIDNSDVPQRCAPNTGVLVKAVVDQNTAGTTSTVLPLLDCVADLKVVYGLDLNGDGVVDGYADDLSSIGAGATAAERIRAQVAEVRVHILAQEGQRDDSYRTPTNTIFVGSESHGRDVDVSGYTNYRWKVYSIVVKPKNLGD
jgi:hypothetical protein